MDAFLEVVQRLERDQSLSTSACTERCWQRSWIAVELAKLLQQYTGGITSAIAKTHLHLCLAEKAKAVEGQTGSKPRIGKISGLKTKMVMRLPLEGEIQEVASQQGQPMMMLLRDGEKEHQQVWAVVPTAWRERLSPPNSSFRGKTIRAHGYNLMDMGRRLLPRLLVSSLSLITVNSALEAQDLAQAPLCSPAQVVDIPRENGGGSMLEGLLHAKIAHAESRQLQLVDPFDDSVTLELQLNRSQETLPSAVFSGDEIFIRHPIVTACENEPGCAVQVSQDTILFLQPRIQSSILPDSDSLVGHGVCRHSLENTLMGVVQAVTAHRIAHGFCLELTIQTKDTVVQLSAQLSSYKGHTLMQSLPGHALIISGVTKQTREPLAQCNASNESAMGHFLWQEAPGATAYNLSLSLGLLHSSCFSSSNMYSPNAIFEGRIQSVSEIRVQRVHSACGRSVRKVVVDLSDFFADSPDAKACGKLSTEPDCDSTDDAQLSGGEAVKIEDFRMDGTESVWRCDFCHADTAFQDTKLSLQGCIAVTDGQGMAVQIQAEGLATQDLLGQGAERFVELTQQQRIDSIHRLMQQQAKFLIFESQSVTKACRASCIMQI